MTSGVDSGTSGLNQSEHGVVLLGVRHHGPGSARAVAAALDRYQPDRILIEGPRDADPLIPLVGADGMEPPVALLAYREQDPKVSAFWPFAAFSPEWSALRYAVARGTEVGFCDLPAVVSLARDADEGAGADGEDRIGTEPGSAPIRSRRWPRPPDMRILRSGGKTSSSTVAAAMELRSGGRREGIRSRPSTR